MFLHNVWNYLEISVVVVVFILFIYFPF